MKVLSLFLLSALALAAQSASFPLSVATDNDLLLAKNRAQTSLTATIDSDDLTIAVLDGSKFTADSVITIDNEIIRICGVNGSTLTVCAGGRGFDETTATYHLSNAAVRSQIVAWHHNRMKSEIIAIQDALGPNLSNVVRKSTRYDWSQQPGGTLAAGNNTITLSPCPRGLYWNAYEHKLSITGGTGTAEVVPIVAAGPGTCTSGAASGTITITAAYTHTGAWSIGSASDGIQEALNEATGTVDLDVFIPGGTHTIDGTVYLPLNASIYGAGSASRLVPGSSATVMFKRVNAAADGVTGDNLHLRISNLQFDGTAFPYNTVRGIELVGQMFGVVENCIFNEVFKAFHGDLVNSFKINDSQLIDNSTIWIGSTQSWDGVGGYAHTYSTNNTISNVTHKVSNESTPERLTLNLPIITLSRSVTTNIDNFTTQALVKRGIGISMDNDCQGNIVKGGAIVQPSIGIQLLESTVDGVTNRPGFNKVTDTIIDQILTYAILLGENTYLNQVMNTEITGTPADLGGGTEVAGIEIRANSWGNQVQNNYFQNINSGNALVAQTPLTDLMIQNNYFNTGLSGGSEIFIANGGTADGLIITGNQRAANSGTTYFIYNTGTGTKQIIRDNLGFDDQKGANITAASTIALTRPVHFIFGSGSINNITATDPTSVPKSYTGPVFVAPAPLATWTMTNAGNIAAPCTPVQGQMIQLFYLAADSKWFPVGCQ